MKKMFLLFALVATLAGCASGVKLDAPGVEDRSGTAASNVSSLDARSMSGMNAGDIKPGPAGVSTVM